MLILAERSSTCDFRNRIWCNWFFFKLLPFVPRCLDGVPWWRDYPRWFPRPTTRNGARTRRWSRPRGPRLCPRPFHPLEKRKLKFVNWPAQNFRSQNAQTSQGSLSRKIVCICFSSVAEKFRTLAEMVNYWAFCGVLQNSPTGKQSPLCTESHMEFKIIRF